MNEAAAQLGEYCERIRVRGLVQGVGFRPTVWQLARRHGLAGEVRNDGGGVVIVARAPLAAIDAFLRELEAAPPPLARIDSIERRGLDWSPDFDGFAIAASRADSVRTAVVADAATCAACRAEIESPFDRRHGYAFTNCTHCGPRLSIVTDIPYDRGNTSMAEFEMCAACRAEYEDPADRRFHAQPNACPDCGPQLGLRRADGSAFECLDPLRQAAARIRAGDIVAIKGLGGYQLACDAGSEAAVMRLRERKRRPHKPLALMARDSEQVGRYCRLGQGERALLESSESPILLLERIAASASLADAVAPGQRRLGFMLPNTALHHLLLAGLDAPIVLTSGNPSGEPQCIDDSHALRALGDIADWFLLHDRRIVNRVDDSVLRVDPTGPQLLRRARGYAPAPLRVPVAAPANRPLLACGAELKNTFCLLRGDQATLSQHIGDLEDARTCEDYERSIELFLRLYEFEPGAVAVDLHPEYLSSKFGRALARERGLPLVEVQHHHAHIAACLAEHGWRGGRVLGIALDGLGFGTDGTIWGGEFLLADYAGYERVARLRPTALAGGARAILEPWRSAWAQLLAHPRREQLLARVDGLEIARRFADKPTAALERMIASGFNSPPSSSCGRLFDAVAAMLGIAFDGISYEGQAAIELENSFDADELARAEPYPFALRRGAVNEIDPAPMWDALLEDLAAGRDRGAIAARFHAGLGARLVDLARELAAAHGIGTVALSGGVFQNRSLLGLCADGLGASGLEVLHHRQVPANDGGLSLGQAVVAAARLLQDEK